MGRVRAYARRCPPLRSEDDGLATIEAVRDGTVDLICSGHDPRGSDDKRLPYADAAPGMAGAETLLALSLTLVRDEVISLPRLVAMLSSTPASLLGLPAGQLKVGGDARSEEHTSELQSLMRISYAVFCLKKKTTT